MTRLACLLLSSVFLLPVAAQAQYQDGAQDMRFEPQTVGDLTPEKIAGDVVGQFNPRIGQQELVGPSFDPFEQDEALAGAVRLRSTTNARDLNGTLMVDGALLEVDLFYNRDGDSDPTRTRDALFVSGAPVPIVSRDSREVECSSRVTETVYLSDRYYGGYRGYGGLTRTRPSYRGFGYDPYGGYYGGGYAGYGGYGGYSSGFGTTHPRPRRPRRDVRRRPQPVTGTPPSPVAPTPRTPEDMRPRFNRPDNIVIDDRIPDKTRGRGVDRPIARRDTGSQTVQPRRRDRRSDTPRPDVERPAVAPPAVQRPSRRAPFGTVNRRTARETLTPAPAPRPAPAPAPRTAPTPKPAPRPTPRPKPPARTRPKAAPKPPVSRRRNEARRQLDLFPQGYNDLSVVSARRDCAVEDSVMLFIPNERLDAARFDGLSIIVRDVAPGRNGTVQVFDERVVYLPPNYIEGFRLASNRAVP